MSLVPPSPNIHTIAFYNTENFFNDSVVAVVDANVALEKSLKKWSQGRYDHKLSRIGMAISQIGFQEIQKPPTIIGLAEIQGEKVVQDLIASPYLKKYNYDFVHYNSPDERQMDVSFIYDKNSFTVQSSETITLYIENQLGMNVGTRDILKIAGLLDGQKIHVFVNHWPSRHEASDKLGKHRMYAANRLAESIKKIRQSDGNAKVIILGDFNDNPKNDSIQFLKTSIPLFNPMEKLMSYKRGSMIHNSKWGLFDQILLTNDFLDNQQDHLSFVKAEIFDAHFLTQNYGKYKTQPYRTYAGKRYLGGFSDHFPVYIQLRRGD